MKNIHLIPTDKPSRLYLIKSNNKLGITSDNPFYTENMGCGTQNQYIYITSDEEIKEGDWYVNTLDEVVRKNNTVNHSYHKKIILTTDQDLIKDGIQAINDEFLEWFVKNPSCEKVEFEKEHDDTVPYLKMRYVKPYKIIIPKENQKQHLIDMMKADEELGLYEEPKQETLEEAVQKVANSDDFINGALFGAKWQKEQMYSEEELLQILESHKDVLEFDKDRFDHDKWFKQFKKK